MATSGTIYGSCKDSKGSATSKYDTWIAWKLNSNSITGNYSNITVYVRVQRTDGYNDSAANLAKKPSVTLKVGGATKTATVDYINTRNDVVCTFATWTGNVDHADDGTLVLALSCSWTMTGTTSLGSGSISGTATLDTIPRATTIAASRADIESNLLINLDVKNGSFTYSLEYRFGSLRGYVDANGNPCSTEVKLTKSQPWFKLPTSFYAQIPDKPEGTGTLYCRTYSGNTQIGQTQSTSFTAVAAQSACAPDLSWTIVDTNEKTKALTDNPKILIRGHSVAHCEIQGLPKNSASIESAKINDVTVSLDQAFKGSADVIPTSNMIRFYVKDSRKYPCEKNGTYTFIYYRNLTCNVSVKRVDPDSGKAELTIEGEYFNSKFPTKSNTLTLCYSVNDGDYIPIEVEPGEEDYTVTVQIEGLDYKSNHKVKVIAEDQLMRLTPSATIGKSLPVFHWGEQDFQFEVPVAFNGGIKGSVSGVYMRTVRLSGTDTFTVQTRFAGTTGSGRQSWLLFGFDNGMLVSGVIGYSSVVQEAYWSGTEGVSASVEGGGLMKVTLASKAYDFFTLISAERFEIV